MSKKPLYPHVPKGKAREVKQLSAEKLELASQLAQSAEDLQREAEKVQKTIFFNFPGAKNLNKRITDAVDALSDVGVFLRTIRGGGRQL